MDLAQLRTFLAVAEVGGMSAAARRRNLSQPAVSLQIRALEEELGTRLLTRGARGVTLTEAGHALLAHSRRALEAVAAARAEVAELRGLRRGTVTLGVTDAAATRILPRIFAHFHGRYPGIDVSVEVASTTLLLGALRAGRAALVLGTLPVRDPEFTSRTVLSETLALVAASRLRAPSLERLLAREPFIAYPRDSITRSLIDAALDRAGLPVRPVMEIGRPGVMVRLVEAGLGVSILPEAVFEPALRAGRLRRLGARRLRVRRDLGLIEMRGRPLEPAARAFVSTLAEAFPAG